MKKLIFLSALIAIVCILLTACTNQKNGSTTTTDFSTTTTTTEKDHTHQYKVQSQDEGDCQNKGGIHYICEECGDTQYAENEQYGEHKWDDEYTIDRYPTAQLDGVVSRHCTVQGCTEHTSDTVLPYSEICGGEHEFDEGRRVVCPGSYSYTEYRCTKCDAVMVTVDTELTPAE